MASELRIGPMVISSLPQIGLDLIHIAVCVFGLGATFLLAQPAAARRPHAPVLAEPRLGKRRHAAIRRVPATRHPSDHFHRHRLYPSRCFLPPDTWLLRFSVMHHHAPAARRARHGDPAPVHGLQHGGIHPGIVAAGLQHHLRGSARLVDLRIHHDLPRLVKRFHFLVRQRRHLEVLLPEFASPAAGVLAQLLLRPRRDIDLLDAERIG
jgi:hypothetical protein